MKDRLSLGLVEFAHKVSKIPFAKALIKPFYYPYKRKVNRLRKENFKKNSLKVLSTFDLCMTSNNIYYSVIFGTLLGAIREHGFIKHDCDIDVAVFMEDRTEFLHQILTQRGFNLIHRYRIDDGRLGCEETYIYEGTTVSIDIFYICPAIDEYPYCCCWNLYGDSSTPRESMKNYGGVIPRRIEFPINKEAIRVPFETIEVNIPKNAHQITEFCYGPDYMIPNPNFVVPKEHRVIWKEKNAIYEEF